MGAARDGTTPSGLPPVSAFLSVNGQLGAWQAETYAARHRKLQEARRQWQLRCQEAA